MNSNSVWRQSEVVLAGAVLAIVLLLVIPLNSFLLDLLLTVSISVSVITLLMTLYAENALAFSSFPSFLLVVTLFRLGLNIASTRMILTDAQAGNIIHTFGEFVTAGNLLVGLVIFTLLTIINFVVITKGSTRIAEVAARFILDALPGKQMAIDADLNTGTIDENEAKKRREQVAVEADFYGAMDGASKYVRGDAIACVIILLVNIFGGLAIGMVSKGMSWNEAATTYVTLTVGDGLVTQIPALLISVGAGILITRVSSRTNLSVAFSTQLFSQPKVLYMTSGLMMLLGFVPGMPLLVMSLIAVALFLGASTLQQKGESTQKEDNGQQQIDQLNQALSIDQIEIVLGSALCDLADEAKGGDLLHRISVVRNDIAHVLGIVIPSVRIHDDASIPPDHYVIKVRGEELLKDTLTGPVEGLIRRFSEVVRTHAYMLLNRQDLTHLIEKAKSQDAAVVEELIPKKLAVGQVLKVLHQLLREQVSVRDLVSILECLADHVSETTDVQLLTEYVRQSLARTITKKVCSHDGILYAIILDPKLEQLLLESMEKDSFGTKIVLKASVNEALVKEVGEYMDRALKMGVNPVLVTMSNIRLQVRKLLEREYPYLSVLSLSEIEAGDAVEQRVLGSVSVDVMIA